MEHGLLDVRTFQEEVVNCRQHSWRCSARIEEPERSETENMKSLHKTNLIFTWEMHEIAVSLLIPRCAMAQHNIRLHWSSGLTNTIGSLSFPFSDRRPFVGTSRLNSRRLDLVISVRL